MSQLWPRRQSPSNNAVELVGAEAARSLSRKQMQGIALATRLGLWRLASAHGGS